MSHVDEGTLQAWIDGELTGTGQVDVETHVAACATCAAEAHTLRDLDSRVHEVLLGVGEAPVAGLPVLSQIRRRARGRGVTRLVPAGLLRAAIVLLALAGIVSAAIPGTPLRQWIEDVFTLEPEAPESPVIPEQPVVPTPEAPVPVQLTSITIAPQDGYIVVRLRSLAPQVEIRLEVVDDTRASVEFVNDPDVRPLTAAGRIEITNITREPVTIRIPRSAGDATVEVNGQVWWQKQGNEIEILGPGRERPGNAVLFTPRS